jgi:hypothetical protein
MRGRLSSATRGEGAFGLIIGLIILIAAIISGIRIIPLHIHGTEIYDAMNEAANFGSLKSPEALQNDVFQKAQDAHVPLRKQDIRVEKSGGYVAVSAKYTQTVDIFGYKYVYNFDKRVEKPTF